MMNGFESETAVGASAQAAQLARMRKVVVSPGTPLTPVAPAITPSFITEGHFAGENVMEDLQLAAELGKTLLERNRELEASLKQQHAVIEDQLQEIEYLSKQTAALREVNDSRLRIYEQLEISIQELEKNNQRLAAENSSDKKKIKSLCQNVETLEGKNDELQRWLEEARAASGGVGNARGRTTKRRSIILEDQAFRRSHSCENNPQSLEERAAEEMEVRARMDELLDKVKLLQKGKESEGRKREELEIQLTCMVQENAVLHDQLLILREKEITPRTFDEELASLDDASSGRLCRKCLGHVDETASNTTLYDQMDSIEDTDASIESIHGECALVKLKNGGYAWGSQESLASIGQVVSQRGSEGTSPGTELSDAPHNSLLSELDTSYRILIEKYEALLEAREQQQQQFQQQQGDVQGGVVHPGVDDMSGPMSIMMTDGLHDATLTMKCQRCSTCTCDLKPNVNRPKSNMEEFSEVETSSSGFSDGESRLSNKSTQTYEDSSCQMEILDDLTPTIPSKCLDLSSPLNPCDKRFQSTPEYKKLFQEIFSVLKKTVDEKDCKSGKSGKGEPEQIILEMIQTETIVVYEESEQKENIKVQEENVEPAQKEYLQEPVQKENVNIEKHEKEEVKEVKSQNSSPLKVKNSENIRESKGRSSTPARGQDDSRPASVNSLTNPEELRVTHKPPRPDSLDLNSRPTSRQKRRRRHRARLDSYNQQQPGQPQQNQQAGEQTHNNHHGSQGSHRHVRREREHSQGHHHHHRRHQDDHSTSRQDGENTEPNRTRIIYNSSRNRCEHHRSRKRRESSNNRQRRSYQQTSNNLEQNTNYQSYQQSVESEEKGRAAPKINYPSVEVAKLRKLEMSYAEVLKTSLNRHHYPRRY